VALWLALSAVGSALLVATTNQVTQNVAAVPLLWVLPLALYLLSFVLCFAGFGGLGGWRHAALILLAVATLGVNRLLPRANAVPFAVQISLYSLTLFIACMACHGELVRLRPDPARLTAFYLALSLGGALGSAAVNLLAPVVLDNFWEFPLGLLACWGLLLVVLARDRTLARDLRQLGVMGCVVMLALMGFAFRAYRRSFHHTTLFVDRNFYGVVRVQRRTFGGDEPVYAMIHGTTIHGVQATSGAARRRPTAYYGPGSGVGRVLAHLDGQASPLRVGVLGLGTGGLAAYGRAGDGYRFYEIDPQVIRLAQGAGGYFDYVPASPAAVQIVQGDARLSLERELAEDGPAHYDLLVLDAFSADAVPVHLLTVEGFALYLAHLAEEGVLAVNASTTHLDLLPLLERLAAHFDLAARGVVDRAADQPCCASRWVLMARDPDRLDAVLGDAGTPLPPAPEVRLWTDDYSNLLQVVRW
jgi:hypothetical protein